MRLGHVGGIGNTDLGVVPLERLAGLLPARVVVRALPVVSLISPVFG